MAFGNVPLAAIEDENIEDCTGPGADIRGPPLGADFGH